MTAISSLFGFLPLVARQRGGLPAAGVLGTLVFGGLMVATVLSLLACRVVLRGGQTAGSFRQDQRHLPGRGLALP